MKLITHSVYGSLIIVAIPDSSTITTTKIDHIIETREDETDVKHELRGQSRLVANTGTILAVWNGKNGWTQP